MANGYIVVFKTLKGIAAGCITRLTFDSEVHFNEWYDGEMRETYDVVDEGVSIERAEELCSTPEATIATTNFLLRKLEKIVNSI